MKKALLIVGIFMSILTAGFFAAPAYAAPCPNESGILGFPAWFKGVPCTPPSATGSTWTVDMSGGMNSVWIVVMNVVQWIIVGAGYVSLYFVIWGGFKFITSQGEPDRIKSSRETIANAVIGLVIVLAAVAIVRTIQAAVISGVAK